jgi:hypothetical protein
MPVAIGLASRDRPGWGHGCESHDQGKKDGKQLGTHILFSFQEMGLVFRRCCLLCSPIKGILRGFSIVLQY